jgi:hypothetical protein
MHVTGAGSCQSSTKVCGANAAKVEFAGSDEQAALRQLWFGSGAAPVDAAPLFFSNPSSVSYFPVLLFNKVS